MQLVRYVGKRGCKEAAYGQAVASESCNVIDTSRPKGNVSVHFLRNGKRMQLSMNKGVRDLFDLGVCVYIADELLDREQGFDGWTRDFEFILPVNDPELWKDQENRLNHLLGHLSGDHYGFQILEREALGDYGRHQKGVPIGFDAVCLFSGGVDSLLGAYALLKAGKKVILCAHYADGISSKAQMDLFALLRERFAKAVVLIQCHVARTRRPTVTHALSEKVEESHRPRSFLFLTTAVAVAKAARIEQIYIPENGLIALNAPLGLSRLGSLSTRTVHPRFLVDLQAMLKGLGIYTGTLHNPFLLQSKTDMLRGQTADLHQMLLRSVSCAHSGRIRWTGKRGIQHCGYCVPCLYRRVAFLEAGIDDASDYYCDVFNELGKCSEVEQSDFRFLVRFAAGIGRMSNVKRQSLVLAQGVFTPAECTQLGGQQITTLRPFADMIERWAKDFLTKLDSNASSGTKRAVGRQ